MPGAKGKDVADVTLVVQAAVEARAKVNGECDEAERFERGADGA